MIVNILNCIIISGTILGICIILVDKKEGFSSKIIFSEKNISRKIKNLDDDALWSAIKEEKYDTILEEPKEYKQKKNNYPEIYKCFLEEVDVKNHLLEFPRYKKPVKDRKYLPLVSRPLKKIVNICMPPLNCNRVNFYCYGSSNVSKD